jgi:hypothetical protein
VGADRSEFDNRILADVGARSFAQRTELFFHMLVSGCDYSLDVNRVFRPAPVVTIRVANSSSSGLRVGDTYQWLAVKGVLRTVAKRLHGNVHAAPVKS